MGLLFNDITKLKFSSLFGFPAEWYHKFIFLIENAPSSAKYISKGRNIAQTIEHHFIKNSKFEYLMLNTIHPYQLSRITLNICIRSAGFLKILSSWALTNSIVWETGKPNIIIKNNIPVRYHLARVGGKTTKRLFPDDPCPLDCKYHLQLQIIQHFIVSMS